MNPDVGPRSAPPGDPGHSPGGRGYGNIYTPHAGSMIIHVQREGGLANRTIVLSMRQVRLLRFAAYAGGTLVAIVTASWLFLASQAARVPILTRRLDVLQHDAGRIDTLDVALRRLEGRFRQVRTMLGDPVRQAPPPAIAPTPTSIDSLATPARPASPAHTAAASAVAPP